MNGKKDKESYSECVGAQVGRGGRDGGRGEIRQGECVAEWIDGGMSEVR